MPKKKNGNILEYEDGRIVVLDTDDSPEWTAAMFRKAKRGKKALADIFGKAGTEQLIAKKVGRPKSDHPKQPISFRFDADLIAHLKNEVPSYNRRVEKLLLQAMQDGRI